jgi:hypothetical protein
MARESAWFQPLNLKRDNPPSSLCFFKCNLYRYTGDTLPPERHRLHAALAAPAVVGL